MFSKYKKKIFLYIIAVSTVVIFTVYIFVTAYILINAKNTELSKADSIIVLGSRIYINGEISKCLQARVEKGVELYEKEYAKNIIFSGGYESENGLNEAEEMKKIALQKDENIKNISLEKHSTSTYENLLFSRKLLQGNKVIIVSDPYHLPRAKKVAEKMGIEVYTAPALESICWTNPFFSIKNITRESLAFMYYFLTGKL